MTMKQRDRAYRIAQEKKHLRHKKPAGPTAKRPGYEQNKRNQERVQMRNWQDWS